MKPFFLLSMSSSTFLMLRSSQPGEESSVWFLILEVCTQTVCLGRTEVCTLEVHNCIFLKQVYSKQRRMSSSAAEWGNKGRRTQRGRAICTITCSQGAGMSQPWCRVDMGCGFATGRKARRWQGEIKLQHVELFLPRPPPGQG